MDAIDEEVKESKSELNVINVGWSGFKSDFDAIMNDDANKNENDSKEEAHRKNKKMDDISKTLADAKQCSDHMEMNNLVSKLRSVTTANGFPIYMVADAYQTINKFVEEIEYYKSAIARMNLDKVQLTSEEKEELLEYQMGLMVKDDIKDIETEDMKGILDRNARDVN